MVKCPRGTLSQIRTNLSHFQRASAFSFDDSFFSWVYDPSKGQMMFDGEKNSQTLAGDSEEQELDSIKANRRSPPTPRDDLIKFFISYLLDIVLQSWEGKPCLKPKLGECYSCAQNESEEIEDEVDLGPCEDSTASSTADSLRDLFHKRSYNSREKSPSINKPKKRPSSIESEFVNEEDFGSSGSSVQWRAFIPDEDVHCVFLNGVWYKGRVSGRLMEGDGIYFWEDGSTFQGEFVGGCAIGKGRLEFPDLSVYEGEVHKAFRHGEGMHCFFNSPTMYCGQWWRGKKHGQGLIVYDDPCKTVNFYRGQWQDGTKEGFGFREYSSGAKYVGFWSNGKRHGKGVMFWNNGDIYRGQWKEGLMHGYGEYTWNGFINKCLSYPATNTYRGSWSEGKRCGRGIFETKNGAVIETIWVNDIKEGPGTVICCNGTFVASEFLFSKDKQAVFGNQDDSTGLLLRDHDPVENLRKKKEKSEEHLQAYLTSVERARAISIPIHSPVHSINLGPHTQKYYLQIKEKLLNFHEISCINQSKAASQDTLINVGVSRTDLTEEEYCQLSSCVMQEEKHLRNFIIMKISTLRACYNYYATMACEKTPGFKCVMLRLFLWEMLIEGGIPDSNFSLIDIDDMLALEEYLLIEHVHDPFERIRFWQFIHILINLSWHLYGRHVIKENLLVNKKVMDFLQYFEDSRSKSVLKAAFEYFINNDVLQGRFHKNFNLSSDSKKKFEESDLAPMEAMCSIYRKIGEAHSARDLMNAICQKNSLRQEELPIVEYFEKLPFYMIEGKNALTVAGELNHLPGPEPFNYPQIYNIEKKIFEPERKSELTCFNDLKAKGVMKCLLQVCPGIISQGMVTNMDYKLTFLEFYKVIILCAELTLKIRIMKDLRTSIIYKYKSQMEEYEKKIAEYEKMKENAAVSRKKSRQFSDLSKKGRK